MTRAALAALLICATPLAAQQKKTEPFAILDNSFLVEEAFNQEARVFQNILVMQKAEHAWNASFTQEWPLGGVRHQLSYTLAMQGVQQRTGEDYLVTRGPLALNYRLQVMEESAQHPAIAPRLSLLLPPNPDVNGYGLQLNVPASKQFGDFYLHANAGATFNGLNSAISQNSVTTGASVIYRLRPMVNLMLESVFASNVYAPGNSLLISPGVRAGINFGKKQVVFGAAVPLGVLEGDPRSSLLGYFSYELPF